MLRGRYIIAIQTDEVVLLVAANVAYDVVHLIALVTLVHGWGLPAMRRGALKEGEGEQAAAHAVAPQPVEIGREEEEGGGTQLQVLQVEARTAVAKKNQFA